MNSLEVTKSLWILKKLWISLVYIWDLNEISKLEIPSVRYSTSLHSSQHVQGTLKSFQIICESFLRENGFLLSPLYGFFSLLTCANVTQLRELRELIVQGGFESIWDFWLIKFKFKSSPMLPPNSCLVHFFFGFCEAELSGSDPSWIQLFLIIYCNPCVSGMRHNRKNVWGQWPAYLMLSSCE